MVVIMDGRTVSIVKEFKCEQRQGANGSFESKEVMFRFATDRDYKVTRYNTDGKANTETPTDFWLCKATGEVAEIFNKYCNEKKPDGKLVSRHLLLEGHMETYRKETVIEAEFEETVPVTLAQGYTINVNVKMKKEVKKELDHTIFMVKKIKFLDSKQQTQGQSQGQTQKSTVTATFTGTIPPEVLAAQQNAQQVMAQQNATNTPSVNVQSNVQQQPQNGFAFSGGIPLEQLNQQNVVTQQTSVPNQKPQVNGMNPPVPEIEQGFSISGQAAPF